MGWREINQQDATNPMFTITTCFGHHYAHHQENNTVYYCTWCSALVVLAVVVWSWVAVCTVWKLLFDFHRVHTANDPAPHNHSQHNQCRTLYAVIHSLVLLVMGIMMPETCWDRSLIIKIWLVASLYTLRSMMHGHNNLQHTIIIILGINFVIIIILMIIL